MSSETPSTDLPQPIVDTPAPAAPTHDMSANDAEQDDSEKPQEATDEPRPLRIYTRAQLLHLHGSPLVQPPPDMPELKTWFGTENEQNLSKKDAEQTTPTNSRDRRFRRDFEDGETPSRPSFRSTLTQPSQMGNFKHQSLRDRDKDRDRDGEKDRERDIRDREGQERLRHLSDKYDRDRLNLSSTNARAKDRDGTNASSRTTSQAQLATSRRGEPRDPTKRKANEPSEDWRRGDAPRSAREDRSENTRRDRERSRPRDSSRPRPDASGRRERGGDRDEGRDRPPRERDDSRRDREEEDESRHWRDDGKRDERVAARKAKERGGDHWEPSSDRRWAAAEERDSRYKRTNGRDRRNGDDTRDRDDRKDREKEKEKEPAWMETYVPSEPLPGILGAVSSTGELDGIQAWKKGLKDKEKEKEEKDKSESALPTPSTKEKETLPSATGPGLDEIQLFRLMMQKEQGKKDPEPTTGPSSETALASTSNYSAPPDVKRVDLPGASSVMNLEPKAALPQDASPSSVDQIAYNRPPFDKPQSEPHFNPPSGPRLLSLGRGLNKPASQVPVAFQQPSPMEAPRTTADYPGLSDVANQRPVLETSPSNIAVLTEGMQRLQTDRSPLTPQQQFSSGVLDHAQIDANGNGYATSKGSRFAKFFDGKARDAPSRKIPTPVGFTSPSPIHGQRFEQANFNAPVEDSRAMDDIIAMLANSQAYRASQNVNIPGNQPPIQHNAGFNVHNNPPLHQHHQLSASRSESLYDSRLDDRSFVPDGMVPGLRNAPPPRSRDNFPDSMDDPILQIQRLQQQQQLQHRADHGGFGGPGNAMFSQVRNGGIPIQQQSYRGGPSPNTAQQLGLAPSRGMPPGLANLGSRPPHEGAHFMGLPGGLNGPLSNGGQLHHQQQQQQFNNFNNSNAGNLGYAGHQQFRGPAPSMNAPNGGAHLSLGNPSNMDPRLAAQFGLGGGVPIGQRGMANNNNLPLQQRPGPPLGPHMGLRPQQQQGHLPPHMLSHMHHPNGPGPQGPTNQPAQDLMALLMGGNLRE